MKHGITINAIELAVRHHAGQKRINGIDYIVHPAKVAEYAKTILSELEIDKKIIEELFGVSIEEIISAIWLHDTVEDTKIVGDEIVEKTTLRVYSIVLEVTSNKKKIKEIGKAEYLIQKMNTMSIAALFVKFLDRYENVSGLMLVPEKFADKYCLETENILIGLKIPVFSDDKINNLFKKLIELIKKELENYKEKRAKINESSNS